MKRINKNDNKHEQNHNLNIDKQKLKSIKTYANNKKIIKNMHQQKIKKLQTNKNDLKK